MYFINIDLIMKGLSIIFNFTYNKNGYFTF